VWRAYARGVHIRAAVDGDAEAIGRLHVRAWQAAYRGVMPDAYLDALDPDDRTRMWRARIGLPDLPPLLVATVDDEVVGFAAFGAERSDAGSTGRGELYAINLDPDHWGHGTGRGLLQRATESLAELGHTEAVLWVVPQNERARALYESEGWTADGATTNEEMLGVVVTEMRYVRSLP